MRQARWVLGLILVARRCCGSRAPPFEEGVRFPLRRRGSDSFPIELLDPQLTEDDARAIADELGEIMADDDSTG